MEDRGGPAGSPFLKGVPEWILNGRVDQEVQLPIYLKIEHNRRVVARASLRFAQGRLRPRLRTWDNRATVGWFSPIRRSVGGSMLRILKSGVLILVCAQGWLTAQATAPSSLSADQASTSTVALSASVKTPAAAAPAKYYVGCVSLDSGKKRGLECSLSLPKPSTQSDRNASDEKGTKHRRQTKNEGPATTSTAGSQKQTITFSPSPDSLIFEHVDFPLTVTATSDSSLPVEIKVLSGAATASGATATIVRGGPVRLEATQKGDAQYQSADLSATYNVSEDPDYCLAGLIPPSQPKPAKRDTSAIVEALGNPIPFSFESEGGNILIYSSRLRPHRNARDTGIGLLAPEDQSTLGQILAAIDQLGSDPELSASSPKPSAASKDSARDSASPPAYSLEVTVPHANSFSSLSSTLDTLNPSVFKVEPIGSDRIRITAAKVPTCHAVTLFLQDIRHVVWQAYSEPPVAQEYHLASASDYVSAMGGQPSGGKSGAGENETASSKDESKQGSQQGGSAKQSKSGGDGSPAGSSSTKKTDAKAGGADPPDPATPAKSDDDSKSSDGSAPAPARSASVHLVNPDLFLFLNSTPGNDGDITEKKRVLAQLDLPRPEVLINVWGMQISTGDVTQVGTFNTNLKRVVADYNTGLQEIVSRGYGYLQYQLTTDPNYFNTDFYRYISQRFVGEPGAMPTSASPPAAQLSQKVAASPDEIAGDMLRMRSPLQKQILDDTIRDDNGICGFNEYCLGFGQIFQPLEPNLMHLLLAIIAADKPWTEACSAINYVEESLTDFTQTAPPSSCWTDKTQQASAEPAAGAIQPPAPPEALRTRDCEEADLGWYEGWQKPQRPPVQLECFRQASAALLVPPNTDWAQPVTTVTPGLGLARAAVADFLFNYKLAQQYPHEFAPYELTHSAQKLDAVLSPFNVAFNRDVTAYQNYLRHQIDVCGRRRRLRDYACAFSAKWRGVESKEFTNNAILTVRTLSATPTEAGVTTQNFLNDTEPGSLSDLLGSTVKGGSGGKSSSAAETVGDLLEKSPVPAQLIVNALKSAQSTEVQIGKSISLRVTPHSLAGASSAELDLKLNVDDSSDPTFYTPTKSGNKADVSRVSNHEVTTRVRVDSLKLVDISSFSAALQRSRTRFPLLPLPGFEVPYVGSLVGIPLPAAKEYHSSTAVLSAIVVPTAADLAYGLVFASDRIVDPEYAGDCYWPNSPAAGRPARPCRLRKAESLSDLGNAPLRNFNKTMISCLASSGQAANPKFGTQASQPVNPSPRGGMQYFTAVNSEWKTAKSCKDLTFDSVFPDAD